jgi:serine phosphatase RsbU (regulator of sigma subunit)/anti-sigma regulatory factor (Ser/Thr protein kinase)
VGRSPFAAREATQRRLELLVRAGELFHQSLDVDQTLANVARTTVESFADLCLFDLVDERTERLYVSVGAHNDPEVERSLKALVTPLLHGETRGMHPARRVAQTGEPFFVPVFDEAKLLEHASSDEHEAFMRRMDYRSKIVVPVTAAAHIFGVLTLVRVGDSEPFEPGDKEAAQELGRRAGLAVANAKQYSRERATQRRLELLVRAGELFHQSLDLEQTLSNVARTAVESFADLCLFDLLDDATGRLYVSVGAHRDAEIEPSLPAMVTSILEAEKRRVHPARHVAQTGETFFVPVFDEATLVEHASSEQHEAFMRLMNYRSKIVVPVVGQDAIFGALTFVRTSESQPFDAADLRAAQELGRRAGLAVANAKQFSREQHVADVLQRAFLNEELPQSDVLRLSAMYQAAQADTALGGDWYDAFVRGDDVIITIGDVTGKGIDAARLMVQLRQWIRLAASVTNDPGEMLSLLNKGLIGEGRGELATAFIGVIDRGAAAMRYACAGHPSPIVKQRSGKPSTLPGTAGLMLGVAPDFPYETQTFPAADASLIVLYTDGVTEVEQNPIAGEHHLRDLLDLDDVLYAANPARYVLRAVAGKLGRDDMAILAVRIGRGTGGWAFDVGDPAAAYVVKRDFIGEVVARDGAVDVNACELIFSELVGNALRYAPGRLSLALSHDDDGTWLHVMDDGPGFDGPVTLPADVWSESGRGLFLVTALAKSVSIQRLAAYGTYVKVLLPTTDHRMRNVA